MRKPRVYVETTIPSLYYDVRTAPEIVARRQWTREWWEGAAREYELMTSLAVLNELMAGPPERRTEWVGLLQGLPLLPIEASTGEIVEAYIRHKLMPADPGGDALHLALASYHK